MSKSPFEEAGLAADENRYRLRWLANVGKDNCRSNYLVLNFVDDDSYYWSFCSRAQKNTYFSKAIFTERELDDIKETCSNLAPAIDAMKEEV